MEIVDLSEPLLLLLPKEKRIIPIRKSALLVAQATRKELRRYRGAMIVSSSGLVIPIETVEPIRLFGKTFVRKIISALTSAWEIRVHFEEARPYTLEQFKELIVNYLQFDYDRQDPFLQHESSMKETEERINAAVDFKAVFNQIGFPPLEECLDVL